LIVTAIRIPTNPNSLIASKPARSVKMSEDPLYSLSGEQPAGLSAMANVPPESGSVSDNGLIAFRQKLEHPFSGAPRSGRGGRRFKSCHSDQLPGAPDRCPDSYPDSFEILLRIARWLTGRCIHCGGRDWRARHDGWTIPTPVCGACGNARVMTLPLPDAALCRGGAESL
jgi:hypothetical protein